MALLSNLIEGDLDQTHPLPPLEQLTEHLRDLILIHWENEPAIQNRDSTASERPSRTLYLHKSLFVSGGKSGAKSYMLFTLSVSPGKEADNHARETFGLEFTVRTL